MKFFLLIVIGGCVAALIHSYTTELKKRSDEYRGIYELLIHIRAKATTNAMPIFEIVRSFSSSQLKDSDFLTRLCDGKGWRESIFCAELNIDDSDKEKLLEYFAGFGKNCFDEEMKRLSDIIAHFKEKEKAVKASVLRDVKIAWLLFATAFVSILILIL